MNKILFVNACTRLEQSRTNCLAQYVLKHLNGEIEEVDLSKENIQPLNYETLKKRDNLVSKGDFSDTMFRYAKQFSKADIIVVAAPFWDLSFPAILKIYFEAVNVCGVTFKYTPEGIPQGLCNAKQLFYVVTSGGPLIEDYGFGYVKSLAQTFYGIEDVRLFKAENLDIVGNDASAILEEAKKEIEL